MSLKTHSGLHGKQSSSVSPNKRQTVINQKKDLTSLIYSINDTLGIQGPVHFEGDKDAETKGAKA